MAFRVFRRLRDLLDVNAPSPADNDSLTWDAATSKWIPEAASGAPTNATYITQTANATLSAEQALSTLATGVVKVTMTTGVLSTATEGTDYYKPGGTDVAVADGGTGASTAAAALSNLGGVPKTLADANSVLYAVTDDTPSALAMGASTILARLAAGNIVAATPSELRTLLALVVGTNVQAYDADLTTWAGLTPSAFFQTLVDDADAAAARSTLGVTSHDLFLSRYVCKR